jgi:hypothetical protein
LVFPSYIKKEKKWMEARRNRRENFLLLDKCRGEAQEQQFTALA